MHHRFAQGASAIALTVGLSGICAAQEPPPPQWSIVTTTVIKPEFRQEYEAFQKEISAAYKKAGAQYRMVVETMYGDVAEYISITPLGKYAELDGPSVLVRAMGEAKSQQFLKRGGGYLLSVHRVTSLALNDLSIRTEVANPGDYAHVAVMELAPGKGQDFATYMKNEYLPAMRKADVSNLWLSQTVFGGSPNERVMVRPMHKLAELDAGPLARKALGPEGAQRLTAMQNGIVESVHYTLVHVRQDLSHMPPPPKM